MYIAVLRLILDLFLLYIRCRADDGARALTESRSPKCRIDKLMVGLGREPHRSPIISLAARAIYFFSRIQSNRATRLRIASSSVACTSNDRTCKATEESQRQMRSTAIIVRNVPRRERATDVLIWWGQYRNRCEGGWGPAVEQCNWAWWVAPSPCYKKNLSLSRRFFFGSGTNLVTSLS
jgi:hypothetical protein